jgi:hypothetical protein
MMTMLANTPPVVVEPIAEADIENTKHDRLRVFLLHQLYDGAHFGLDEWEGERPPIDAFGPFQSDSGFTWLAGSNHCSLAFCTFWSQLLRIARHW